MALLTSFEPKIEDAKITFSFPDRDRDLATVRLAQEIVRPRCGPEFIWREEAEAWQLDFLKPDADRMEYQFQLVHEGGGEELLCDPSNPLTAPGAFGDKSVLEMPGYQSPSWLAAPEGSVGEIKSFSIKNRALRGRHEVWLWSPAGSDPQEPLPLLIAHDGPEYAKYSGLTLMLDRLTDTRSIPRLRAALVAPLQRDQAYSASAAYSRSLTHDLIPQLLEAAPTPHGRRMRIGMGASLGALAMLHAHRRSPATFGALYLQSGSYFRQRYDKQESGFSRFRRISRFMGEVLTANEWLHPIPVTMTCGTVEENLANNRATHRALASQGYEVELIENRDGHNWVGWRDTFDPHLVDLLNKVWG
jgi:enterochelin esterase family protein